MKEKIKEFTIDKRFNRELNKEVEVGWQKGE